ncbi:MAG: nicotinate phosphoribosyltransferase family-domain-containing protein [Olpidium bornovanus]|uniref:Nicotinamide phosphoribosyltransferase n=1 Tax=Olpidium bornovanus TaxID=278681 RepID=A0A8H8DI84_9FUNG|nr:MAG: nicotinate phosphoribosyltransferase family-domain-containing protein [Olpidium bornovanus]
MAMIREYGHGAFAVVMDTYDYVHALEAVLPAVAKAKTDAGGFMVIRPDSGDTVDTVLQALRSAEKVFGSRVNGKGFKVLNGCGVIQGDGVTYAKAGQILKAVESTGFSAQNVAMGMGGGLLQRVNRDMLSFATKLSHISHADGSTRDVLKYPKTEHSKASLPGEFVVVRTPAADGCGIPVVYPKETQFSYHKQPGIVETGKADSEASEADVAAVVGIRNYKHSGIPEMGIVFDNADEIAAAALEAGRAARLDEDGANLLRPVYDHGPVLCGTAPDGEPPAAEGGRIRAWDSFDVIRRRAREEWRASPKTADVVSPALKAKTDKALQVLRRAVQQDAACGAAR